MGTCANPHDGNAYSENDYETEYSVLYANLVWQATKKLELTFNASYTDTKAGFDTMYMSGNIDSLVPAPGHTLSEYYDYSTVNTFSDLDYETYEFSVKTDYQFTDIMAGYSELAYSDVNDNEPYVYGDYDGSWFLIHAGLRFIF